jgi:hypothetical protein
MSKRVRQLVNNDGTTEQPWEKNKKEAYGLPPLFQLFKGKIPKHLINCKDSEELVDVLINIYGTAQKPIFLAKDIGHLCKFNRTYVSDKIKVYKGSLVLPVLLSQFNQTNVLACITTPFNQTYILAYVRHRLNKHTYLLMCDPFNPTYILAYV